MKKIIAILIGLLFITCQTETGLDAKLLEGNWSFKSVVKEKGDFNWDTLANLRKAPKFNLMHFESNGVFIGDVDGSFVNDTFTLDTKNSKLVVKNGAYTNYADIFKLSKDTVILSYRYTDGKPIHEDHLFVYIKDNETYDGNSIYNPALNEWRTKPKAPLSDDLLKTRMKSMIDYLHKRYDSAIMKGFPDADMGQICIPFTFNYNKISLTPRSDMCKTWEGFFNNPKEADKAYSIIANAVKNTKFSKSESQNPGNAKELYYLELLKSM
jgi:hypothetical protein